jgi:hypothetical protein
MAELIADIPNIFRVLASYILDANLFSQGCMVQRSRRMTMDREDDVIDLGTASLETKGPIGEKFDDELGRPVAGLADE